MTMGLERRLARASAASGVHTCSVQFAAPYQPHPRGVVSLRAMHPGRPDTGGGITGSNSLFVSEAAGERPGGS